MTKNARLVALALLLSACTGSGSTDSTGGDAAVETTAATAATATTTTTTTTTPATDAASATCTALKVALFDLDETLGQAFADPEGVDALSDEEAAVAFLSPLVGFYEELATISETAPSEVAGPLGELSSSIQPLADVLASGDLGGLDLEEMQPPFELSGESAVEVDAWAAENCGTSTSFDPEELITTTLFAAAFGALGGGLGELGELGEGLDDQGEFSSAEAYGDDPELDALWDACEEGDDVACDDLYWSTFGVYEAFAQTCGGRAPYNGNGGGSCEERMASDGPAAYGDDVYLDSLWDACESGDTFSCDSLSGSAPVNSEYAAFGTTCGGTAQGVAPKSCSDPDQAFVYGDDPELDALWDACEGGDASACNDLYFESPLSSTYETFGDTCGILLERNRDCTLMVELLETVRG